MIYMIYMIKHRIGKTRRKEDKDKEEDINAIGLEGEWTGLKWCLHSVDSLQSFRISYNIT